MEKMLEKSNFICVQVPPPLSECDELPIPKIMLIENIGFFEMAQVAAAMAF